MNELVTGNLKDHNGKEMKFLKDILKRTRHSPLPPWNLGSILQPSLPLVPVESALI